MRDVIIRPNKGDEDDDCPVCGSIYVTYNGKNMICPSCAAAELARLRRQNAEMREALEHIKEIAEYAHHENKSYFIRVFGSITEHARAVLAKYPAEAK